MKKIILLIICLTFVQLACALPIGNILAYQSFDVQYDDFAYWNRTLTAEEINELYYNSYVTFFPTLCVRGDLYVEIETNETAGLWWVYDNGCPNFEGFIK